MWKTELNREILVVFHREDNGNKDHYNILFPLLGYSQ